MACLQHSTGFADTKWGYPTEPWSSNKFKPCADCATGHSRNSADVSCQHWRDRTNGPFHMESLFTDLPKSSSDSTFHPDNRRPQDQISDLSKGCCNHKTLDTAEAMQVQHVSTGEREPTDLLHLKLLPDPQQHTWHFTLHAGDFSLPTVSEPSCSYQHTTTGRKYAEKRAISESCKHSGCAEGKQRRFRFVQTVNNAKVIWESKTKLKPTRRRLEHSRHYFKTRSGSTPTNRLQSRLFMFD